VPIVLEHFESTGDAEMHLRWQSANQALQIIPTARMFATPPPQILSATEVLLLKDGPVFNYQIVASGSPTSYGATNLPTGWTISTATGLISGSPNTAGTWEIPLTATNASGSGSAILTLNIISTGSAITRDGLDRSTGNSGFRHPARHQPHEHRKRFHARRPAELGGRLRRAHSRLHHGAAHWRLQVFHHRLGYRRTVDQQ
jgi:hypothetical protein